MADEEGKILGGMTPEELKEYSELAEKIRDNLNQSKSALDDISTREQFRLQNARDYILELENISEITDAITEAEKEKDEIQARVRARGTGAQATARETARKVMLDAEIERLRQISQVLSSQAEVEKLRNTLQQQRVQMGLQEIQGLQLRKSLEQGIVQAQAGGPGLDQDRERLTLMGAMQGSLSAATAGIKGMAGELTRLGAETMVWSMLIPGMGFDSMRDEINKMAVATDDSYRSIMKAGLYHAPKINETYISMIDPLNAANEEFGYIAQENLDLFMGNIGIMGPEAAAALTSARNEISLFRRGFIEASKENKTLVAASGETIAALQKMGVATDQSAGTIDFFNRALKESPRQALESVRRLENVAHSLDVNVSTVFQGFGQVVGELSQYGTRTIDVFADLQAQSVATGIDVGKLSGIATKLDTFKGAAQAAQGFNAILGKTVLSVTDLVHAEPAEKIELLKDAMDRSGTSFETANRRVRSMIASMIGADSVADAARIFGSSDDYFKLHEEMDTTATDIDDLKARVEDTMTVSERANATMSSLVASSQTLLEDAYSAADKMSNMILSLFGQIRDEGHDAQESFLGMLTLMNVAGARTAQAKTAVKGAFSAAMVAQTVKEIAGYFGMTGGAIPPSLIYSIEDSFGVDFGGPQGMTPDTFIGDPANKKSAKATRPRGVTGVERDVAAAGGLGAGAGTTVNLQIPFKVTQGNRTVTEGTIRRSFNTMSTMKPDPIEIEMPA